jgi:hypothetical protein
VRGHPALARPGGQPASDGRSEQGVDSPSEVALIRSICGLGVNSRMVQDAAKYALQPALAESNLVVGEHFSAWCEERAYSPIIELACMPDAVSTMLAKAGVALWEAAQAEAAAVLEGERRRMAEAVATERELRNEALGMVDAREAVIEGLRAEIARHAAELDASRRKVATVRAREFWLRVVQEVWEILPEQGSLHVNEITMRIGADLVQEAERHRQVWDVATVRGGIDERRYKRRMFVSEGGGRYRRRRPEDAV